jgi:sulfinoalanine decarboxylase/sulfinoalanine decarboxylase/aspartate 1-decarboxylase
MDTKTGSRERERAKGRKPADPQGDARRVLRRVLEFAEEQLGREQDRGPIPRESPTVWRQELDLALGSEGLSEEAVIDRLSRILAATPSSANPRFLNQLFGGRDPIATLAEMLTPLVNSSMYTYKVAGPQVLIEQELLGRMSSKIGYEAGDGTFCPGGSLSNLVAMLLARNEAVASVRDEGLRGEPLLAYTSVAGHYSVRKNAGILGLGRHNVRQIPADDHGRMDVEALRRQIALDRASGGRPLFVNATAGTTVLGAFDPLREIARVADGEGLWFHVDGALGGSVLLSRRHRHLLDGAELSDSFAWNAHKMMGVPLSCSVVLVRQSGLLHKHLSEAADYLFQAHDDELNPGTRSLQCGRRNDALKLWAAWQLHGDRGYDERLERLFELARYATQRIERESDLELVHEPQSVNVCFRVHGLSSVEICDRLDREGRLLVGHGRVGADSAIRFVFVNPDLDRDDIDTALLEIADVAGRLRAAPPG